MRGYRNAIQTGRKKEWWWCLCWQKRSEENTKLFYRLLQWGWKSRERREQRVGGKSSGWRSWPGAAPSFYPRLPRTPHTHPCSACFAPWCCTAAGSQCPASAAGPRWASSSVFHSLPLQPQVLLRSPRCLCPSSCCCPWWRTGWAGWWRTASAGPLDPQSGLLSGLDCWRSSSHWSCWTSLHLHRLLTLAQWDWSACFPSGCYNWRCSRLENMSRVFNQSRLLLVSAAAVCQFSKSFETTWHHLIYCRAESIHLRKVKHI